MRWQVVLTLTLLLGPVLAGCIEAEEDPASSITEGYGHVKVYVHTPLEIDRYPHIWSLDAVPRLVAFIPGDNDTRIRMNNSGYIDVAKGWPSDWGRGGHGPSDYPDSAVQDWMRPRALWYEGEVPVGNYSVIRIEFMDLHGKHVNGRDIHVRSVGDRLSIGAPEGGFFAVRDGETHNFAGHAYIMMKGEYDFEIR